MTEVTTDTTDRNDRPVAVGGIDNYAAARSVVSTETDCELLLRKETNRVEMKGLANARRPRKHLLVDNDAFESTMSSIQY